MKKFIAALAAALMALATFTFTSCSGEKADFTVGIVQPIVHDALSKARTGFTDKLTELMKAAGKTVNFDYQNANGNSDTLTSIVSTFISKDVDIMVTIGTGASQTAAGQTKDIPILFTAVTDPVSAGLVKSNDAPGGNVSGTSDMNPVEKQTKLMKELGITKVAFLYTSSEDNSKVQVKMSEAVCDANNMTYQEFTIASVDDIPTVMNSISNSSCDGIYIPTDNAVASAIATVHACNKQGKKLPVVCGESSTNDVAGVATYSVDYEKLGSMTAQMAFDVLVNGKAIGALPVKNQVDEAVLSINQTVATDLGFTIPQSVLDKLSA